MGGRSDAGTRRAVGAPLRKGCAHQGAVTTKSDERLAVCSIPLLIAMAREGYAAEKSASLSDGLSFMRPAVSDLPNTCRPGVINSQLISHRLDTSGGRNAPRDHVDLELSARLSPDCVSAEGKRLLSGVFHPKRPAVRCGMTAIERQPHVRRGLSPERVAAGVRSDYLLEAERSRGVKSGCGAVLAVFPCIPIELVSRIRFDEGRGLLAYTLVSARGIGQSRIHDLAAVKEATSGRVFLVPRRTKFQVVALQ